MPGEPKTTPQPDGLLDAIPDPMTVRGWLSQSVLRSEFLRRLLRVAERKAASRRDSVIPVAADRQGGPHAG